MKTFYLALFGKNLPPFYRCRAMNDIEKEYRMTRRQRIKGLMECFDFTRKEAIQWLKDGNMKRKKAREKMREYSRN